MSLKLLTDAQYAHIKTKWNYDGKCPTCRGAGVYHLEGAEYPCDCETQMKLTKAYYNANIGRAFHGLGWDDFVSVDREHLYPYMQEYISGFESKLRYGMGWTLSGQLGTGKTLVLCCTLKDLLMQGYDVYFCQGTEVKDTFIGAGSYDNEAKRVLNERLRGSQVLGLDDLIVGVSDAQTRLYADALESVVRYRYNNALPTLITTNLTMEEEANDLPRVFSLLTAVNDWLRADGEDVRATLRRKRLKELQLNNEVLPVV